MTALRFAVSTPASFVADVVKQDTFRKIVKSILVLKLADTAGDRTDLQEETLIKSIKSLWLRVVEVEGVVAMDSRPGVSRAGDLVLWHNLQQSVSPLDLGDF